LEVIVQEGVWSVNARRLRAEGAACEWLRN